MKNYREFEKVNIPMVDDYIGIVGLPSGEYIELNFNQYDTLNRAELLQYNKQYKCITFDDLDIQNILYYIKDDDKEKIINFLQKIGIEKSKYKINDDYSIDVLVDVKIRESLNQLPVKFDYVMGDFDISSCGLINLFGCPEVIEGNFICSNNRLTDLKMGPKIVYGDYDVRQSNLYSLIGSPKHIKRDFDCSYNNLSELFGAPKIVDGSFYASNCLLITLAGSPDITQKNFDCSYNLLESLQYGPDFIKGTYDCSYNDIKSLDTGPSTVGVFKYNGNKKLTDIEIQENGPLTKENILKK